jgi:hypothetical protein
MSDRALSDRMDFDHVVRVDAQGRVTDEPEWWAPSLNDGVLEGDGVGWVLLGGYSGQYGYSGPIMHSSEYIGGSMARDILARPGLYVSLVDYSSGDDEDTGEPLEPEGWAVAYLELVDVNPRGESTCSTCGDTFNLPAGTALTRGSRPCGWSH